MRRPKFTVAGAMWAAVWSLSAVGVVAILCYAVSTPGRHLTYFGTGLLTAFAAGLTGSFFGFLLGIPRAVSSGEVRQAVSGGAYGHLQTVAPAAPAAMSDSATAAPAAGADGSASTSESNGTHHPTGATPASDRASRFAQSTNLAEISDWLTKLLLGAGLVSLTKLGEPAGRLFRTVAGGLATSVNGTAVLMAGATVITYVAIGFMATYVGTTVWYTRLLERES